MRLPVTIRVGDVVIDDSIYPRNGVQRTHVTHLIEALLNGAELPALVVEKKTKRSIDGAHRTLAYRKLYGPDHTVPVEWVGPFANDHNAMLNAAQRNADHGLPLTEADRARTVCLLVQHGVTRQEVASVLRISVTRVQKLEGRIAYTPSIQTRLVFGNGSDDTHTDQNTDDQDNEAESGDESNSVDEDEVPENEEVAQSSTVIALKRDTRHWSGEVVEDERTAEALRGSPGSGYRTVIKQLIRALHTGILDGDDESMMSLLSDLQQALNEYLG